MTDRPDNAQSTGEDRLVLPAGATGSWRITVSSSARLGWPTSEPSGPAEPSEPAEPRGPAGPSGPAEPGDPTGSSAPSGPAGRPDPRHAEEERTVLGVRVPEWPVLNAAPLPPAAPEAGQAADDGEEFVPPDPPLPKWTSDRVHRTGWVLVLLGPVLFLIVGPLGWDPTLRLVSGAVFVGGLVLLATRLPDESRRDDPDAGARV